MTAPYTAESLAAMTGVELSEVVAGCLGWTRANWHSDFSNRVHTKWIKRDGTECRQWSPHANHNHAAELKKFLMDNFGCHIEITVTPHMVQAAIVPGNGYEWPGMAYRDRKSNNECTAVCIVFVLAAQALGVGVGK